MTRDTPSSTNIVVNEQKGYVVSIVDALKYKTDDEVIEGLVATTGVDKVNDTFTKAALKDIAEQLQDDIKTVDAFFMDADEDALEKLQQEQYEGTTGNVNHNNDPAAAAMGVGDPRVVPAFKLVDAKYVENPLPGVEAGVKVRGRLNTEGNPEDVAEAIRYSLKNGFVDSMSIEYIPRETSKTKRDGKTVRVLQKVEVRGSAITARPANPMAKLTDVDLKSLIKDGKAQHREKKKSVAGVSFRGTRDGKLDESEIPNDDYESYYLFDGDTKTESSYPVVDADDYLRRGNVEAAHELGARGGVSSEELKRKLQALNDEFDNPPIDFDEDGKNIMGDETPTQDVTQDDLEELKSDFEAKTEQLEETINELQSKNESLQEDNDELQNKLEDLKTVESVSDDVEDLKEDLEELDKETEPIRNKMATQYDSEIEQYVAKTLQLADAEYVEDNKEDIAREHDAGVEAVEQALSDIQGDS